ncbi:hypothetical protein EAH79_01030 [Sphingomonas koreensis]|nr:hypothetical protein EAH79_01030 [Sphingomonas koreensis]
MDTRIIAILAAGAAAAASPLAAQAGGAPQAAPSDILQKAINQPGTNWQFYGGDDKGRPVKAPEVPGGEAVRVKIAAKGANPWDVGALSPIQKPIAAGDAILVAVYLRAPMVKDGETTAVQIGATGNAAPYIPIAGADVTITNGWKLYYAAGKAGAAFAGGAAQASVQLAADKHVVDLGPVFVLDFGPNQDIATLPHN